MRKSWDASRAEWERQRSEFDRQQFEWTQQIGEWESRLAGHVSRIEELEAQLAEFRVREAEPIQSAAACVQPVATPTQPPATEPAAVSWSSWEATAYEWPNAESRSTTAEPIPPVGLDWTSNVAATPAPTKTAAETAEAQVPAWESEKPAEPPTWERHAPAWENEPPSWEEHGPADDENPTWDHAPPQPQDDEEYELPIKPETDVAGSSVPHVAPVIAPTAAAAVAVAPSIAPREALRKRPRRPQKSNRNRFRTSNGSPTCSRRTTSAGQTPPAGVAQHDNEDQGTRKPRNGPVIPRDGSSPEAASGDNEESIEDYMTKLMQRVRGDRPVRRLLAGAARRCGAAVQPVVPSRRRQPPVQPKTSQRTTREEVSTSKCPTWRN